MTLASLRARLARVSEVPEPAVRAASRAVEDIAAREGGTVRLGKKRRTVKLRAVSRIEVDGKRVTGFVQGIPVGPWVWKNTGTAPHMIPTRPPTPRRPRPMHGDGYDHPVSNVQIHHPGSGGRGNWARVQRQAADVVPEIIRKHVRTAIRG